MTMQNMLMAGAWRFVLKVPPALWQKKLAKAEAKTRAALAFMTPDHCRVHHHVVSRLPMWGRPLPPAQVAADLEMDTSRVVSLLDELERRLTFVFRNPAGEVTWAYPVTVEATPHRVTFDSGETLYAA
jgi:hypothetical protein